jgi:ABC-type nitrate/sulfonate/bicarbonate transport system permease component
MISHVAFYESINSLDGVFAVLIVVALITTGMATITSALEHRLLRWQKQ